MFYGFLEAFPDHGSSRGLRVNADAVFRPLGRLQDSLDYIPPRHTYFISMKSSMPYTDPSRPSPDCFTPPNGATSLEIRPVLTPTIPYSSASATRKMRATSRL